MTMSKDAQSKRAERRRHVRVPIDVDVVCKMADDRVLRAKARDASVGGMFIESAEVLVFGTELSVECTLRGADYSMPAVVRWTRDAGFGVQFGLFRARETHALNELIREANGA